MDATPRFVVMNVLAGLMLAGSVVAQTPQVINYQGRLLNGTNLVNGSVGLSLRLYKLPVGGSPLYEDSNSVTVVDGLYSTFIGDDSIAGSLTGAMADVEALWVEVVVNGTTLFPRERIASVAYSLMADGVKAGGVTTAMLTNGAVTGPKIAGGAISNTHLAANAVSNTQLGANSVTGTKILDGSVTSSDVAPNTFWTTTGNAGTTPGTHFIGTTDGQSLELRVNGSRAGRFDAGSTAPTVMLGAPENIVGVGASGASVLGGKQNIIDAGGSWSAIGSGYGNAIKDDSISSFLGSGFLNHMSNSQYAVMGGGFANVVGHDAHYVTLGGGEANRIQTGATHAMLGGGRENVIRPGATNAVLVGGMSNSVGDNAASAVIGGGQGNRIDAGSQYSAVVGGWDNIIKLNADLSFLGGGWSNSVQTNAFLGFLGGGFGNTIQSSSIASVLAGGYENAVGADYAVVPGGRQNRAGAPYSFAAGRRAKANHSGAFVWADSKDADFVSTATNQFLIRADGGIGVNVTNPVADLHIVSATTAGRVMIAPATFTSGGNSRIDWAEDHDGTYGMRWLYDGNLNRFELYGLSTTNLYGPHITVNRDNGFVGIGTSLPGTNFHVSGTIRADIIEITGGSDLAEPFNVANHADVQPGHVVCIDPDHPGELCMATESYDRRVAGIVSGANGISAGLTMKQDGSIAAGRHPVALTGRVYCWAVAEDGAILPGDLLTTSDVPGHAMKARDPSRTPGAVLGKAMTPLEGGKGLVLVLVTLQ